jgi:hypothetical protein
MVPEPATAVAVPPHVLLSPLGVATTSPAGKASENDTPASATVLAAGLVIVTVSVVVALRGTAVGLNAFAIDGGATTARLADAVPPVPPSVEVTAPVVLFCCPATAPVTFTERVHEPLAASVAPVRLITFVPCVAVIVPPPQVPVCPLGVEMIKPAGSVSLNPTPLRDCVVFALLIVKLKDVVPLSGTLVAPNALIITGAATTVMLAFEVFPVPPSIDVI